MKKLRQILMLLVLGFGLAVQQPVMAQNDNNDRVSNRGNNDGDNERNDNDKDRRNVDDDGDGLVDESGREARDDDDDSDYGWVGLLGLAGLAGLLRRPQKRVVHTNPVIRTDSGTAHTGTGTQGTTYRSDAGNR